MILPTFCECLLVVKDKTSIESLNIYSIIIVTAHGFEFYSAKLIFANLLYPLKCHHFIPTELRFLNGSITFGECECERVCCMRV